MTTQAWVWFFLVMALVTVLQKVVPLLWKKLGRRHVNHYTHVDRSTPQDKLSIRLVDSNTGKEIYQVYLGKEIEEFWRKHNEGEGVIHEFSRGHVGGKEGDFKL